MKKYLSSFAAGLFLLFSVAANADQITSSPASGSPGESAIVNVGISEGSFTEGGDFTVTFDHLRLSLLFSNITVPSDLFLLEPDETSAGKLNFSLAYFGSSLSSGSIFSLGFSINDPYPDSPLPKETSVAISGVFWHTIYNDDGSLTTNEVPVATLSIVTVEPTEVGEVPEPGVLALVALGLLIMTGVGRRSRLFR